MKPVFAFKPWARLKGDAQKVGEEIERIRQAAGGALAPRDVVTAARPDDSLLHGYFDWNDQSAGEKYRESQAAHLIRSIVVVRAEGIDVTTPLRAFVSVRAAREDNVEAENSGTYTSIVEAVRVVSYREQLMHDALRDLDAYRQKYQALGDITKWTSALENARKYLQRALDAAQEKEAA